VQFIGQGAFFAGNCSGEDFHDQADRRRRLSRFRRNCMLWSAGARAQDVPGIEICTVEKTMERRTSCLQSNVDFLQKTITKLGADHQQKLDGRQPADRRLEKAP